MSPTNQNPSSPQPKPPTGGKPDGPKRVKYTDANGCYYVKIGGDRSWRTNNPGNIGCGSFATSHGAIGCDTNTTPHQAIFPDPDTGLAAMVALLQGPSYSGLTIDQALRKYNEVNQDSYNACVAKNSGLDLSQPMSGLSNAQLQTLVQAQLTCEGQHPGSQTSLRCPSRRSSHRSGKK